MRIPVSSDTPHADPSIGVPEPRSHTFEMLDHIRRQEQTVALSKVQYLQFGEKNGVPIAEMAEAIGMSTSGVRRLLARAASGPSEADGATA